ncbi:hypothetical protein [Eubacterium ramulus]|uniref:alginate O-acetyltransferase AlgX-related protein n=1 Tax=Eubacterium ramulus TaxID=39490 RepID=UPI0035205179
MFKKILRMLFIVSFCSIIGIPLITTNFQQDKVSESENRKLTAMPKLHNDDGSLNENFTSDLESWINDNIGLRSQMVIANAKIQFYGFNVLANNSDMLLGPNQELNYATNDIIADYQHEDLKTQDKLNQIASSYQRVSDYLEQRGIQFYYFQCWDKQSIYPEYFPKTVKQFGDVSKTDQIIATLKTRTTVDVISSKELLIDAKKEYDTYSVWGDPTHWTQRGAYLGYRMLMEEINAKNQNKYKILSANDYNIEITDQGYTVFGGIHKKDMLEDFEVKDPQAYLSDEEPRFLSEWANKSRTIYYNDKVDNNDTLLILGDSYFDNFLYDDFAESFHRVVFIWGDYAEKLEQLVDYYQPSIVINENAERCDRTEVMISASYKLSE